MKKRRPSDGTRWSRTISASSRFMTVRRSNRVRSSRRRSTPTREAVTTTASRNPEALLALGGRRGKQLQVLTDGTYFVNRWFATVEFKPKTVIPIGYVGVVVSYYGSLGEDLTGDQFRYGEQVERGRRGVWRKPLPPGKYPLNPFALKVELVPTVNFVLRWITGMVEEHQYDKDLQSIALITADGYEPVLPLSLVLHIDYEMAPRWCSASAT